MNHKSAPLFDLFHQLLSAGAVTALLSAVGLAQTSLYHQPLSAGGGVLRPSTVWTNNLGIDFENDTIAWDDFELGQDALVTRVRWVGTDALALGFQIEFFHQEPASSVLKPDVALSGEPPISSQTVTGFTQQPLGGGLVQFEADLATPMFCAAHTTYHLSIIARAPATNVLWSWASTPNGLHGATWWRRGLGIYYSFADDRAFELLTAHDTLLGTALCVANSQCPCGNDGEAGEGCENSSSEGAVLVAYGSPSVAADDARLVTLGVPTFESCLMIASTNVVASVPFYDGRRCLGAPIQRFGLTHSGASGSVSYGPGLGSFGTAHFPLSGQFIAGRSFGFQTWYRDNHGPCNHDSNLSSGRLITFLP
ncbi:MAG: hypothetical protein IT454_00790 [Planctomycetes bacterium]|nr:hypothetical protein [Planctomycetota bacterium]